MRSRYWFQVSAQEARIWNWQGRYATFRGVIFEKLCGLEQKGCVRVLSSDRVGTRLEVFLPNEIADLISSVLHSV